MNGVLADFYSWLYQIPLSGYIRFRYITFLGISDSVISVSIISVSVISISFVTTLSVISNSSFYFFGLMISCYINFPFMVISVSVTSDSVISISWKNVTSHSVISNSVISTSPSPFVLASRVKRGQPYYACKLGVQWDR